MGTITRGIKNAFRNSLRTIPVVFILALSIGMSLAMFLALKTVQAKIDSVKSSIGNYITVSPAGIRGFEGGGELLIDSQAQEINKLANVSQVITILNDRATPGTDTTLQAAIEAGSFGNRQQNRGFEGGTPPSQSSSETNNSNLENRTFTIPISFIASSDLSITSSLNVSEFNITTGEKFADDSTDNVALLGSELATKNNLSVGSTFTAFGNEIKVVGIYDSGTKFTNASVVMPIATLQKLTDQAGEVSSMIVQASSIDATSDVVTEIKNQLGDKADVVSQQDSSEEAIKPLENIKTISLYSLIGSLAAGAIIILLIMIMIVRERKKEIGVLKAIGSSNIGVVNQFIVEALTLTIIGSIFGMILGFFASNPILNALISNSSTSSIQQGGPGVGTRGVMSMMLGGNGKEMLNSLHIAFSPEVILYGFLAAIVIAIIGSAIPAFFIAKIRPAEVLRSE